MNEPAAQRPASSRPSPALSPAPPSASPPPRGSELFRRLGLVSLSIVATLVLLELGLRAVSGGYLWAWPNFVAEARSVLAVRDGQKYLHDPQLGYVPRPGYSGNGITIVGEGLRHTGFAMSEAPILAVGDSFTFGDEVADDDTWPAQLAKLSGRQVLNGGVSGYGFDQIVLRAEQLAPRLKPGVIVVAFIADDIRRTEMRRLWSADKPYFVLDGRTLALRNVPVPPRTEPLKTMSFWQRTLGYSFLFDFVLRRLDLLHDWYGDHIRVHPPGTGEAIACALTGRLADLQARSDASVLVVAEYDPVVWDDPKFAAEQRRMTGDLLACARRAGLATLDTWDALAASGRPRGLYGLWHLNRAGNGLVAKLVAGKIETMAAPSDPPPLRTPR